MKNFLIFLIVCVCLSFVLLTNEVIHFSILEIKPSTHIHFVKNDAILNIPFVLPQRLSHYDVNYKYAFIPKCSKLSQWCANVLDEVIACTKQKYPVIMSIHFFIKTQFFDYGFCQLENNISENNAVIIVPLTSRICYIENKSFINNLCIISHPKKIQVNIDSFLVVRTQKCKAWDL